MQSEPNHQHQNYAERKIQDMKSTANVIMNRVGAPSYTWYLALKYLAKLLSHFSGKPLDYKTSIEVTFEVTPGTSNLLQFYFYQPVIFLDTNKPPFLKS